MKKSYSVESFFKIVFISIVILLLSSQTSIPSTLRQGITTDEATINLALQLQSQGWTYIMPQPKSAQARWGNTDGRTTWYIGYWFNEINKTTSLTIPVLKNGVFIGDNMGGSTWRKGGSPSPPSHIEWLLSKYGGITPTR